MIANSEIEKLQNILVFLLLFLVMFECVQITCSLELFWSSIPL